MSLLSSVTTGHGGPLETGMVRMAGTAHVRRRTVVVVGALVMSLSSAVASAEQPPWGPPPDADGPPVQGCPSGAGWFPVTPSGPDHLSAAFDLNNDGQVCARWLPAFDGTTLFTFMDNVVS